MPSKRRINDPTEPVVEGLRELIPVYADRDRVIELREATLRGVPIWYVAALAIAALATLPIDEPVLIGALLPVLIETLGDLLPRLGGDLDR
jgi:hypothetical protein